MSLATPPLLRTTWLALSLIAWVPAGGAACSGGPPGAGEEDPERCPIDQVLDEACACGSDRFEPRADERWVCTGDDLRRKDAALPVAGGEDERCNGLDDDLDGEVDEGGVCAAVCTPDGLAALAAALTWPTADDQTVASDSDEVPELTEVDEVPAWCRSPAPATDPETLTVRCGEVWEANASPLAYRTIRIAPGGVVRLTRDVTFRVSDEMMICPGAVLQASGRPSATGDGEPGHDVRILAEKLIHLGRIETRGGTTGVVVGDAAVGASAGVSIVAGRLLLAGLIETSGRHHPSGYGVDLGGGAAGAVEVRASRESFLSGTIRTIGGDGGHQLGCGDGGDGGRGAPIYVEVPVCCHGFAPTLGGGNGGNGGFGEDPFEVDEPALLAPRADNRVFDLALCDGSDLFLVPGPAGTTVTIEHDPAPGEDLDVWLLDGDGVVVARSEGIGAVESVTFPRAGVHTVRVFAASPILNPGPYRMTLDGF
jgi:hypothetical protein